VEKTRSKARIRLFCGPRLILDGGCDPALGGCAWRVTDGPSWGGVTGQPAVRARNALQVLSWWMAWDEKVLDHWVLHSTSPTSSCDPPRGPPCDHWSQSRLAATRSKSSMARAGRPRNSVCHLPWKSNPGQSKRCHTPGDDRFPSRRKYKLRAVGCDACPAFSSRPCGQSTSFPTNFRFKILMVDRTWSTMNRRSS
jgi:hypothetical protein